MKKDINKQLFKNHAIKIILAALLFILVLVLSSQKVTNNKKQKVEEPKDTSFAHTEEKITKDEIVDGVKFTNIILMTKNGQTTFTASVINTTNTDIKNSNYKIDLLDKKERVVITLIANVPNGLKPNEMKNVTAVAKGEFRRVTSKRIRK